MKENDNNDAAAAWRSMAMFCASPPRRRQISAAIAALKPSDAAPASAARNGVTRTGSAPSKAGALSGASPVILFK